MADLSYIDRDLEVKIVGQDATGTSVNYVSADVNGNMLTKDYSDGPVAPGTAALTSMLTGGQYNSTPPTLTNTQQSALQLTSSGALIVTSSGSSTATGTLTNNNAAPAANNLGVLPAVAEGTLSASRYTTGDQVLLVTDLAGNTNVDLQYYLGAAVSKTNPIMTSISDGTNSITAAISAYGTAPTGTEVMGVNAFITNTPTVNQGTSPWIVKDEADGPVTPGTVSSFSQLAGGQFNTTAPAPTTGQQVALQVNAQGALSIQLRNKFKNVTGNATTVVKSGEGTLSAVSINNASSAGTITIYDNTAGSGTKIMTLTCPSGGVNPVPTALSNLGAEFTTGLTVVTAGAIANDFTIFYT